MVTIHQYFVLYADYEQAKTYNETFIFTDDSNSFAAKLLSEGIIQIARRCNENSCNGPESKAQGNYRQRAR